MLRLCALVVALAAGSLPAADPVAVPGSDVKFPSTVGTAAGGKPVTLKLTGVGVRSRAIFKVYAIGSYLADGTAAKTAEDVVAADAPKMLYLVMERNVAGKDFVEAVKAGVGKTHPDKFAAEFQQIAAAVGDQTAAKGDHVSLLYLPGVGLRVQIVGKVDLTVKGAEFAAAVWGVYLGGNPVDEKLKQGLSSLIGK